MNFKKVLLSLCSIVLFLSEVQAGGDISKPIKKVVVPVAVGVATGGASFVVTHVAAQAVATGVTAAITTAVNQNNAEHGRHTVPMSFGVGMNGNGNITSTNLGLGQGSDGRPLVNIRSEVPQTNFGVTSTINRTQIDEQVKKLQKEASARASKSFFTTGSKVSWEFFEEKVGEKTYNRAKGADKDILVVPGGYGVNLVKLTPFEEMLAKGLSSFNLKTEDEKVASGSFLMEATSLLWRFESKLINGEKFHRAYVPDMPKFDVITKADNKWWIPAGQYKVADEKPTVRSTDRSAKERHVSPPRVNTRFEEICKGTSEFSSDLFEFAKSCIPEEVKSAGKFVFEYAKDNSPQFVRQSFEFTAEKLAWAMSELEEAVSDSEPSVRRYLRDDLGLPQWVSQDIGSIVGIGGKCVLAFMPGKVISESTKVIKLISVSFANGAGAGFKIALEQPLAKYKTVKFEKPKGTTSKGGTKKTETKIRVASTQIDLDRYVDGFLKNKGALLNRGKTLDGHQYYEVMKKTEYMGQTFKKGDYISLDTLHYEVEWFSNPKTHKGAINVLTGKLFENSADPSRILKIK